VREHRDSSPRGVVWPNCLGRLGLDAASRVTREADFLIHRRSRWGILEVDGQNYHGASAAQDHARDRVFLQHGHLLIQRFAARDCLANPAKVVADFFKLLANPR
jgi:very-short-patch-repair endonuclease